MYCMLLKVTLLCLCIAVQVVQDGFCCLCVCLLLVGLSDRAGWQCVDFHPSTDPTFSMGMVIPKQGLRIGSPKTSGQSSLSAPHPFGCSPLLAGLPLPAASLSFAPHGAVHDPKGIPVIPRDEQNPPGDSKGSRGRAEK